MCSPLTCVPLNLINVLRSKVQSNKIKYVYIHTQRKHYFPLPNDPMYTCMYIYLMFSYCII